MKICAVSPGAYDPTSWYRSNGPLIRMQKDYEDFQFVEYGYHDLEWNVLMNFDVLFLQRPCELWQVQLINKAINLGLKIWIDWDDMLWDVDPSSPVYDQYSRPDILHSIKQMTSISPQYVLFTVSTQELADQLAKINPSIRNVNVVPNAYDQDLFGHMFTLFPSEKWMWRGSATHDADLLTYAPILEKIIDIVPVDWIGSRPWMLNADNYRKENLNLVPWTNFIDYLKHLRGSAYRAAFCVLKDTPFNRCKSNIFWIEATIAGAVMIAPDWPEWERPGIINYKLKESPTLYQTVEQVKKMTVAELQELRSESIRYIESHLTLKQMNEHRYSLLKQLI